MHVSSTLMTGAPPAGANQVTLSNWQDAPFHRWSFQHVRELMPTHPIPCAPGTGRALLTRARKELADLPVMHRNGAASTLQTVIADTYTDAALMVHDGEVVFEHYRGDMQACTPHLLMSVSKSLVGCVAGVLVAHGLLDVEQAAEHYVPELTASGYAGARVRDILDMRTGVHFSEDYTDLNSEARVIEEHAGWRPSRYGRPLGIYSYLATLGRDGPHGAGFVYRSSDTDTLGWICERATGTRMADLISTHLWQPMGAEFDAELTCDPLGSAMHDGGVCARTRDLARFGQLLLNGGKNGDSQVIPVDWLDTAVHPSPDVRAAFAASPSETLLPGGWYSSKFWFVPGPDGAPVQLCRGIHGQLIMVDHQTRTVTVKLSTWPDADNDRYFIDTLNAFSTVGRHLAGLSPRRWLT